MMAYIVDSLSDSKLSFLSILGKYVADNIYSGVETEHFISIIGSEITNLPLENIMYNWIYTSGFPLLSVNLLSVDNFTINLIASQRRFGYGINAENDIWWIPFDIKLIFEKQGSYMIGPIIKLGFLNKDSEDFMFKIPYSKDWKVIGVIPNPDRKIFYRYGLKMAEILIIGNALNENIDFLSASDRAGFFSDIFALVETKKLIRGPSENFHSGAFRFLYNENSNIVWQLVLDNLKKFLFMEDNVQLTQWFSLLIQKMMNGMTWTKPASQGGLSSIREMFFSVAVWIKEPQTIHKTLEDFKLIIAGHHPVENSLESIVYYSAIRWAPNGENFNILWNSCKDDFSLSKMLGLVSSVEFGFKALMKFQSKCRPQELNQVINHILTNQYGASMVWRYFKTLGTLDLGAKWAVLVEVVLY
jgi:hypothetical protein